MKQELIDLLEEIRIHSNQLSHTFTKNIANDEMNISDYGILIDGLKEINIKSQSAFLNAAELRRK